MRILMTADAAGGVGVFADELAAALVARGHQVLVAVFSPTRPAFTPGLHRLWAPFRLEWMDADGSSSALAADAHLARAFLADLARHWHPDILHANHFAYAGALRHVPTLLTVHSDVVSWWRTVRGTPPPDNAYQRWYAVLARQALACSSVITTPSQAARFDLLRSFPHRGRTIRVIANGRDPALFQPHTKQPLALAAGRLWDEGKQLSLLGALPAPLPLSIAVAGPSRHPLLPVSTPCPRGTRLLGSLAPEELRRWMAAARAFIGTSCYEPFGLAVLEGAFSCCALLLRDIPTWRELWGAAASFYSTPAELHALLERATREPAWAAERGLAACHHARRRYSAVRMAQAYEAAYAQAS